MNATMPKGVELFSPPVFLKGVVSAESQQRAVAARIERSMNAKLAEFDRRISATFSAFRSLH